jgi:sigma-B regulation protein RsbU (phosphoserine phosphatase)
MFVSVFLAKYEPDTGALTYTNAGHPPPLIARGGAVTRLTRGGMVLGIVPDARYDSGTAVLDPGAMLVLYTDGLTEARGTNGTFFTEATLTRMITDREARDSAGLHRAILTAVSEHRGRATPEDDVTLVVASRAP